MRTARLLAHLVPLAAVAVLAGCSGDPAETEPSTETTQAADDRVKDDTTPDADEPADEDAAAPDGDLAACLLGEWAADMADVSAQSDAMMAAMGMPSTTTVTGESRTVFAEDTVSTTYVEYVTEVTFDMQGQQVVSRTRMNGTLTQPYTLAGDVLTSAASEDLSGFELEGTMLIDGEEVPGYSEGFQQGVAGGSTAGQSTRQRVSCSGDTLTMTTLGLAAAGLPEISVELARR